MSVRTVQPERTPVAAGSTRRSARRRSGSGARPVQLVHGLASDVRLWDLVAVGARDPA